MSITVLIHRDATDVRLSADGRGPALARSRAHIGDLLYGITTRGSLV